MHRSPFARALPVLLASLVAVSSLTAQEPKGTTVRIMRRVAALLEGAHLTRHELDDEISRRGLPAYLDALDPLKVYYRKEDVAEFEKNIDKLDDMLEEGDFRFAQALFDRFLLRLAERVEWTRETIAAGQDFTLDEEFVTDPEMIDYPKGNKDAKERWRKRVKYDLLRLKGDEVEEKEAKDQVLRRYKSFLRRMKQFDQDDILTLFITAIASGYDPHTTYMSRRTLEDFEIRMRLNYQGIGARLVDADGYPEITSIMPGGAAKKQGGLFKKDKILAVAQGDKEFKSVIGMRLNDAVQLIRGKTGTVVRLKVRRKGSPDPVIVSLTRAKTELVDQKAISKIFEVDGKDSEGKVKVGVIDLPSFYGSMGEGSHRSCSKDVQAHLENFEKKGVDVVVLDLRFNGGGLLNEAVAITGLFVDKGPVVQVRGFRGEVDVLKDRKKGFSWKGPLVVVTSKFSASASEIVSGAIKDYGRGLVVGDVTTHGKGTVQRVLDLGRFGRRPEKLGALKLTVQQFFRPSGVSTQVRGVKADVALPSFTNEVAEGEGELKFAVPFNTISPQTHDAYGMVDGPTVSGVAKRSKARMAQSKFFLKLKRDIEQYRKRKDRKTVTLNFKKYQELLASIESDEKKVEEQTREDPDAERQIEKNEYLTEVLEMARDYRELLRGRRVAMKR